MPLSAFLESGRPQKAFQLEATRLPQPELQIETVDSGSPFCLCWTFFPGLSNVGVGLGGLWSVMHGTGSLSVWGSRVWQASSCLCFGPASSRIKAALLLFCSLVVVILTRKAREAGGGVSWSCFQNANPSPPIYPSWIYTFSQNPKSWSLAFPRKLPCPAPHRCPMTSQYDPPPSCQCHLFTEGRAERSWP